MKTRMTELFGIKHPIMLAGMNWLTEPKIVAAVCNAGGLGNLAISHHTPDELRSDIRKIRDLTDSKLPHSKLWGITGKGAAPFQVTDGAAFIPPAS